MEHPFVTNLDQLTAEQLSTKISELNNKLMIGMQSGNMHLCNQIRMALESYQNKYQQRLQETFTQTFDKDVADKINIQ